MDLKLGIEILSLIVAIGAAMIAWRKAQAADRSAKAAERAAEAAERNYLLSERKLGLDLAVIKQQWIDRIAQVLVKEGFDGPLAFLPGLPNELKPQWLEIMDLAAMAGKINSRIWKSGREEWMPEWEKAIRGSHNR